MIGLGDYNTLRITRFTDHGACLDGGEVGEILMPKAYVRPEMRPGDEVRVFVYLDQSERLVGTTEVPLARVGETAFLEVAWVNRCGAFLKWGLMKDLFCPFGEQKMPMEQGRSYLVRVYVDPETYRIAASAKLERFLGPAPRNYGRGRRVQLIVQQKTALGFKVVVDGRYRGLVYDSTLAAPLHTGQQLEGQVVARREDGRLDCAAGRIGLGRIRDFAPRLLEKLEENGGSLPLGDASAPEEVRRMLGVSKKTFKQALGVLYKARRVELSPCETRLAARCEPATGARESARPSRRRR